MFLISILQIEHKGYFIALYFYYEGNCFSDRNHQIYMACIIITIVVAPNMITAHKIQIGKRIYNVKNDWFI